VVVLNIIDRKGRGKCENEEEEEDDDEENNITMSDKFFT